MKQVGYILGCLLLIQSLSMKTWAIDDIYNQYDVSTQYNTYSSVVKSADSYAIGGNGAFDTN